MADRTQGGRSRAALVLALALACALVAGGLQWLNHGKVRAALCGLDGLDCRMDTLPTGLLLQGVPAQLPRALLAQPLQLRADTALLRRDCGGHWMLGFGARLVLDPVALGEVFGAGAVCVDALRQSLHVAAAGGQLRYGGCAATLEPLALDWDEGLRARLRLHTAPEAAAACAALLPASLGTAVARQLVAQGLDLDLQHGLPYAQRALLFAPEDSAQDAQGWLRRALAAMPTQQALRVDLPDGSLSLRLASTPAQAADASPELTLAVQAQGGVAALLPDALRPLLAAPTPLTVRWHLDHETGVQVNGQRFDRLAATPRAPGATRLGAAECGPGNAAVPATMYFVEAGDGGQAADPAQARALFDAVDAAVAGPGALVSVFVHGWQHSAAPGDSYVCDYAKLMGAVEAMERQAARATGRAARQVLGVYVGWPGRLYADEIASGTTFWNRLQAADRLGADTGLLRALVAGLAERVARGRPDPRADRRSALVVTGHSLGGRAVFQALRERLLQAAETRARPDLVLLVNPAFSAEQYRGIHAQEQRCQPVGMPLLSFSSEADQVTRQVYPAGQALTFDATARQAAPFPEHVYTAANFGAFVTHRLRMEMLQGAPPRPSDAQTIVRGFARVPAGSDELYADDPVTVFHQPASGFPAPQDAWYRLRLQPVAAPPGRCPQAVSRVVEVDARVLPDHGTVFTPAFMEYVVRVLNHGTTGRH